MDPTTRVFRRTLTSKAGRGRESGESEVVRVDRTGSDTKKKLHLRHESFLLNSVSVATEFLWSTMIFTKLYNDFT